jgi:hypothetical protein
MRTRLFDRQRTIAGPDASVVRARAPAQEIDWSLQHEKDSLSLDLLRLQWDAQRHFLERRVREAIRIYDELLEDAAR